MSGRRGAASAGFLLTETLAAFAISACVLVALASLAPAVMHAIDASLARLQEGEDLDRTMAAIARDAGGLARLRWAGREPQGFVFEGGPNSLFVARRESDVDGHAALRIIALREIATTSGPQLVRSEATWPTQAHGFKNLAFRAPRSLPTAGARLHFSYLAAGPNAKRIETWPSGDRLPEAILIEAVDAQSRAPIVTLRVAIHADADLGCIGGGAPTAAEPAAAPATPPNVPAQAASSPTAPATGDHARFCGRADRTPIAATAAKEPEL